MDSILINTPISSPLHPQANLPLLKGHLESKGFKTKAIDSNVLFFHWFLGESDFKLSMNEIYENPVKIFSVYDKIEKKLYEKSQKYDGLSVGLRYLSVKYDRIQFDSVIESIGDEKANPFIEFFDQLVEEQFLKTGIKLVCIGITFQDQIISAFTLADQVRKKMPHVKIVMGGQIITRCYDSMIRHAHICRYFDYLALWDGENVLEDIHRREIRGQDVKFVNVIDIKQKSHNIDRKVNAPTLEQIPSQDFSDTDFNAYFFPEMLVPLQTTRGCYGSCEFCAIPFGSNYYRIRLTKHILDEIVSIQKHTLEKYGRKATFFKFMEDTSSPARLYDISVEIEQRGLDVKWETFARLEKAFTKDGFMGQLFRGGCRKIHWGLESSDPGILKNMNKKISASYSNEVLELSAKAGILNFCFIIVGFPGETDEVREGMIRYIIENENIHTITPTTFDLTRGSPMQRDFDFHNPYGLEMQPAEDFQVRLPYTINGQNWKSKIVPLAHKLVLDVVKERPDIGLISLFPDQLRSMYCDKFTNKWGQIFLERYGENNVKELLANTEKYIAAYNSKQEIDPYLLPESLRREHFRTKEDIRLISSAITARKRYESRRLEQV